MGHEIVDLEVGEKFLSPPGHDLLRYGRHPFLPGQGEKVAIVQQGNLVHDRLLQHLPNRLERVPEKSSVRVWPRYRNRVGSDFASSISPDNPMRIQKRKLRMACDRVDVVAGQVRPLLSNLPVLAPEIQIPILSPYP